MPVSISFLGTFQVTYDGTPILNFYSNKSRALFAYLAIEQRPHERGWLSTLLWDTKLQSEALNNLRQTLYRLRSTLDLTNTDANGEATSTLLVSNATVQLNADMLDEIDVVQFSALIAETQAHRHRGVTACQSCMQKLQQAMELYCGEFLGGFTIPDSWPFEHWLEAQRTRMHAQAIEALGHLARYHRQRGEYSRALEYLQRWTELEPWSEEAYYALMQVLAYAGKYSAALYQYKRCHTLLASELGIEPSMQTKALYMRVQARTFPDREVGRSFQHDSFEHLADISHSIAPRKLPQPATPFVGRVAEANRIAEYLANPDCHLLTINGPAGCGKTRLALHAAEQYACQDGIVYIPLAGVTTKPQFVATIARHVGLDIVNEGTADNQLIKFLRDKDMLLLLDQFEGVPAGDCESLKPTDERLVFLTTLLTTASSVIFLVTARNPLGMLAEWVLPIEGLSYPSEQLASVADLDLELFASTTLFLQTAQRIRPSFSPNMIERYAIHRICQRVHGVPCMIELAAMRTVSESLTAIAATVHPIFG